MRFWPFFGLLLYSITSFASTINPPVIWGPNNKSTLLQGDLCFPGGSCIGGGSGLVNSVTASPPLFSSGGANPNLTCQAASGSQAGCLSSADWSTFNGKQDALSFGDLTDIGTDGISVMGGTGAVVGSGTSLAQHVADSTHNGYLSQGDWATFNGKQPAGNYITALTGDGSASGPGSATLTMAKFVNRVFVDLVLGSDTLAGGTPWQPWKTIQYACNHISPSINVPISIIVSGGNNDTDTYPITCPPNIELISPEYGLQLHGITITGGATNDGVTLTNIVFLDNITWVRNDATEISLALNNSNTFSGLDFEQQGSGVAATFLFIFGANAGLFGTSTIQAGETIAQSAGILNGTITYKDSGSAYFISSGGTDLYSLNLQLNGGITTYLIGNIADYGYSITGTTTGSGTPYIITDSSSVPASISGSYNIQRTSFSQWMDFTAGAWLGGSSGAPSASNVLLQVTDGHEKSTMTTPPTATVNANAGTGASCSLSNATDTDGTINLTTTATSPVSGEQCKVNFNKAYNVAPICQLTPQNANAGAFSVSSQVYQTTATNKLSVNFGAADAAGHAYVWSYHCAETQ